MPKNEICYMEIPAPNLRKAKAFYSKVFGWKVRIESGTKYAMFDDGKMGGGFDPKMKVGAGGMAIYLKVKDIPGHLKKIRSAGGKIVKEKTSIGPYGFYATFKDPNGNRMSVWAAK